MVDHLKLVPAIAITPAEQIRQRIKKIKPPAMIECRCGSRQVLQVKSGVLIKDGKPSGGTKQLLCAACFAKGDLVILA